MPRLTLTVSSAVLAGSLFACGGGDAVVGSRGVAGGSSVADYQPISDDVAKLVPADAKAVVYIAEPQRLIDELEALAAQVQPGSEGMFDLDMPLMQIQAGFRAKDLDLSKPMAIAVVDDVKQFLIVGAKDPGDVVDLATRATAVSGSHVAMSFSESLAEPSVGAASTLLDAMPRAGVSVRLDLSKMQDELASAQRMLESQAGMMPDGELAIAMFVPMFEYAKRGGHLDLLLGVEGGNIRAGAAFDFGGTAPANGGDFTELLAHVPASEGSVVFAGGELVGRIVDLVDLDAVTETMPAEARESYLKMIQAQRDLYAKLDGVSAGAFGFGEGGMRGVYTFSSTDPATAHAEIIKYAKSWGGDLGISVVEAKQVEVDGVNFDFVVSDYDAKMFEAMAGDNSGAPFDVAAFIRLMYGEQIRAGAAQIGEHVVTTFGVPAEDLGAVVEVAKNGGANHAAARRSLARMPNGQKELFMHMDIASILRVFAQLDSAMPELGMLPPVKPGASAPMWFGITRVGTRYRGDFEFHLGAVMSMFK